MRIAPVLLLVLLLAATLRPASAQSDAPPSPPTEASAPAPAAPPGQAAEQPVLSPDDKADAEIGKSAAADVEKQYGDKFIKDSPDLPRILNIIDQIRPVTERPHQTYQVTVIGIPGINAFTLPGGYLYYTQGLLEGVESDDELAAVTAHEMAHICLNHPRKLMNKEQRYVGVLAPVVLASILSRSESVDPGKIAVIGSLVLQDALNHYGQQAESEADLAAVRYLHAGKRYHPVAVLTVTEGLAHIQASLPQSDLGVAQTHPYPKERAEAVIEELKRLDIPIERRRVLKSLSATAAAVSKDGKEIGELRLSDHLVAELAAEDQGASPVLRAQRSAEALSALLLADLQLMEIGATQRNGAVTIGARGEAFLTITSGDAALQSTTLDALAKQAMEALRVAFQEEKVKRYY